MPLVLKAEPPSYSPESITRTARILRAGGVAVFPTETVYGVGADIRCPEAVGRVFALKRRELSQPLMVHCASPLQMFEYVDEVPQWVQPLISHRFRRADVREAFETTANRAGLKAMVLVA